MLSLPWGRPIPVDTASNSRGPWTGKGHPTPHIFLPVCSERVEGGPGRSQSIFQMELPPGNRKLGKRDFPSAQQMLWSRPYIGFLVLAVIKAITQPDRAS